MQQEDNRHDRPKELEKMIYKHEIDKLTDEEKEMLVHTLNEAFDSKFKIDINTVTSYKKEAMLAKLRAAKDKVNSKYVDEYCDMCRKLGLDL